ncbi:MAG: 5-formyltetrahydrofolate cyclo-ligase [Verrucomicrobiota bacterium]
MDKSTLRRKVLADLKTLSPQVRSQWSSSISRALTKYTNQARITCLGVFDPLPSEPDIRPFVTELLRKNTSTVIAYPRCHKNHLHFYEVTSDTQLIPVPHRKFREPDPTRCPRLDPTKFDLILVPGLAFSPRSHARLGRGGGFYDRLLSSSNVTATTIGVCFDCQRYDTVPVAAHDQFVSMIISESTK